MKSLAAARPIHLTALAVAVASLAAPAAASTLEEFLNAPVWYVKYEVSFTSAHQGSSQDADGGTHSFTIRVESGFSAMEPLNLRSGGPGPIRMLEMAGTSAGSTPSVADAQKLSTDMMALMDHTANWLAGGPAMDENATDAEIAAASEARFPARVDYLRVDTGKNLTDEMGSKFDRTLTTTVKGSGLVLTGGLGVTVLEMDTAEKTFTLQLPYGFNSMLATATRETIEVVTMQGSAPVETKQTSDVPIGSCPNGLALATAQEGGMQGGTQIRGTLNPASGRISGEQSFNAQYQDGNETVPGTLLVKYTLTMTRPTE